MNLTPIKTSIRSMVVFLLVVVMLFPPNALTYAAAGDVTRVSVDSSGGQANAYSYSGQISADGRFVAFDSDANNLVPNDTNNFSDVFLRDRQLGTTVRVSVDANGAETNNGSGAPAVSADGRFVAFESDATNLIAGDTNGFTDIYLKDMQTGAVTRVSVDSSGAQADNNSSSPSISGDGRYVAFATDADNLAPNDVNGVRDIIVRDVQGGVTMRASVDANATSFDPVISLDGRFVAFSSSATNLVGGDTNGKTDVFVFAIQTGQVTRESINTNGEQGDQDSSYPAISGDGRYLAFASGSTNFMTEDTNQQTYAYVRDRQLGTLTLASVDDGFPMLGHVYGIVISANGRYLVFDFDQWGDGAPQTEFYLHDRETNQTISTGLKSTIDGFGGPIGPSLSSDGLLLAFASSAANLVSNDTNGMRDIFVKELAFPVDVSPTVFFVQHSCGIGCSSPADQVIYFAVTFSEAVTGVDASDFALTLGGGISGAAITAVSGSGGIYYVTVDTGSGDGTIRLDVIDDDSIKDNTLNPLGGAGAGNGNFTNGDVYTVNKSIAAVTSILRVDPNPSMAGSVRFTVNFSEAVTGVDAGDFSVATTGAISGAVVTDVSGSGNAYTVTVNTGSGEGTLRLDLVDNDSILDSVNVPLGGLGAGNANFSSGETYTIDRSVPTVTSILRTDPNPTAAGVVHFNVSFSEPVSGVDGSDFVLTTTGVTGAALSEIVASGNLYTIAVNTGTGNGTIRLDVVDNDSIVDASGYPLGGAGAGNGNFTTGDTYTISKVTYVIQTERLRSNGTNDGWLLESSESSNQGGTKNSTAATFNLGDDGSDRQYRAILHFPTSYLPDNAVITKAILTIKVQGVVGTNPFTTHGNISVDIRYGPFGSFGPFGIKALQVSDFQAPASLNSAAVIPNNPTGGWYWAMLDPTAFPYINLTGATQLRLGFQLDDNDDMSPDYLTFYSGDTIEQTDRPHLVIEYYVP